MIIPLILAGGSGTRLWPLSRELFPKQLLELTGSRSMLQNTVLRLKELGSVTPPVIICNEDHRFMVAEQMRSIDIKPLSIILEPAGRNTAPAIAAGAIKAIELFRKYPEKFTECEEYGDCLSEKVDKNADESKEPVLLVLPADHIICNVPEFLRAVELGAKYASGNYIKCSGDFENRVKISDNEEVKSGCGVESGYLVTFGIVPEKAETGYGYIRKKDLIGNDDNVFLIDSFVEKPDSATAETYLASGEYLWNSGMFMFTPSGILQELGRYEKRMVSCCSQAVERGGEDLDFFRLEKISFEGCESRSIDYAVMEKTSRGAIIPLSAGWNDLGSWEALWQTGDKDGNENVIVGDVIISDVRNSYIRSSDRLIAALGIEDQVIVETKDAVLVASRDQVQNVKKLVEQLKSGKRGEAAFHCKIYRPWGSYETVDIEQRFQVKRITVKPGAKLSLQKHHHRAEHWTVVSGTAIVTKGDEEIMLTENESTYIPLGTVHRLENPGKIPLELIEVQSGSYLGEDDIVRFEDVYGRQK